MEATDYIVVAVVMGILFACLAFDLWVRSKERG